MNKVKEWLKEQTTKEMELIDDQRRRQGLPGVAKPGEVIQPARGGDSYFGIDCLFSIGRRASRVYRWIRALWLGSMRYLNIWLNGLITRLAALLAKGLQIRGFAVQYDYY